MFNGLTASTSTIHADVVVLGGGTAGAVVAGRLIESTSLSVLIVEAGPDYGPLADGAWPADLLDSSTLPASHDWGYKGPGVVQSKQLSFDRARVIGGCSSHNGCSQTVGYAADYEAWGLSWSREELALRMTDGAAKLRVRRISDSELTPFQHAAMESMTLSGIPRTDDLDDLAGGAGCGPSPVNNPDGLRWNTAVAYLDPVRDGARLRVIDRAHVECLELDGAVVRRAYIRRGKHSMTVEADRFVLCGGTYGSPEILLRSGVGPADELEALGIPVRLDLPGVGRNLHDHPTVELRFAASAELSRQLADYGRDRAIPDEQVIGKGRSRNGHEPYDLHVFPWTSREAGGWTCVLPVASLTPKSRGALRLVSADRSAKPVIDHAFLADPADLNALRDGVELCLTMARSSALAPLLGQPLNDVGSGVVADRAIHYAFSHYWHPVGTCAIGQEPSHGAVVDASAKVHGTDNLWVIDASIIPVIPRATTNLPVVALAEHLAHAIASAHLILPISLGDGLDVTHHLGAPRDPTPGTGWADPSG